MLAAGFLAANHVFDSEKIIRYVDKGSACSAAMTEGLSSSPPWRFPRQSFFNELLLIPGDNHGQAIDQVHLHRRWRHEWCW